LESLLLCLVCLPAALTEIVVGRLINLGTNEDWVGISTSRGESPDTGAPGTTKHDAGNASWVLKSSIEYGSVSGVYNDLEGFHGLCSWFSGSGTGSVGPRGGFPCE
jgi:hypothetical protein